MMKAVIIDDEPLARNLVREYLQLHPGIMVAEECGDGFEGVKAILKHKPDLVFLDIQMPRISGFEMLELLDQVPPVIFTTAFDEYALKAFETHAVDYLLKPFSQERFDRAILKWRSGGEDAVKHAAVTGLLKDLPSGLVPQDRVVVRYGSHIRIIPGDHIDYLEAYDDYVKIYTGNDCFLKKQTMARFEQVLPPGRFLRIHRSYIVNLQRIEKIEPFDKGNYVVLMKNGKRLPLSRSGYSRLKAELGF